ncbi:MAG TPA: alpha/beta hydrolase [Azospirillaceae bacterium]|nr:alpha/beta hydrolase [Azospirillaceae bacterium]
MAEWVLSAERDGTEGAANLPEGVRLGRMVTIDGARAHIIEEGEGRPVLLLHGLGGLAQEIVEPLQGLSRWGRVIAVDRPGYGLSDPLPREQMAADQQARWLARLLTRLEAHRPVIVAHSLAASVAISFAMQYPRAVAGLVLLAPFARPTRPAAMPMLRLATAPVVGGAVRTLIVPWLAHLVAPAKLRALCAPDPVPACLERLPVAHAARASALLSMAAELHGFNGAMIPAARALPRLTVPTAIIAGTADRIVPFDRHAYWLSRRMPQAKLEMLPGVGHMPHHCRPEVVMKAVAEHWSAAPRGMLRGAYSNAPLPSGR